MIEERVIASWKFKKGVLDPKTAISFAIRANAAKTHADILKVYEPPA